MEDQIDAKEIERRRAYGDYITGLQRAREALWGVIVDYTKARVRDYHFMDHKVSTFWRCDQSPVGMCIFNLDKHGRERDCRYCGGPLERK